MVEYIFDLYDVNENGHIDKNEIKLMLMDLYGDIYYLSIHAQRYLDNTIYASNTQTLYKNLIYYETRYKFYVLCIVVSFLCIHFYLPYAIFQV